MEPFFLEGREIIFSLLHLECRLLWDEALRKSYLDVLTKFSAEAGFEVYAFSVFSDRIYMITGRFGVYTEEEAREVQFGALRHFLKYGDLRDEDREVTAEGGTPWADCVKLKDLDDVLDTMVYIHLVAQDLGYIRTGIDYWWSSAQTYRKRYRWKVVRMDVILAAISTDREHARRIVVRRHRVTVWHENTVPVCIKNCVERNIRVS